MRSAGICSLWLALLTSCSFQQMKQKRQDSSFEQIDFQALMKRYMKKENLNPIEGIYSVSGTVVKKGKGFMSDAAKETTKDRKDNYAQVAILRDAGSGRDFLEISLDKEDQTRYSVVGEFKKAEGGHILVYKHMDAKGKATTFTFTVDSNGEMLEGVRVENEGSSTITYKLNYVKLSPNAN